MEAELAHAMAEREEAHDLLVKEAVTVQGLAQALEGQKVALGQTLHATWAAQAEASEWKQQAEVVQAEALEWKQRAEGIFLMVLFPLQDCLSFSLTFFLRATLNIELSEARDAAASATAAFEAEAGEREGLEKAILDFCKVVGVEDVVLGSSLRSRLSTLGGQIHQRLKDALHTGVKCAMAVISSHYTIDLEGVSDGYGVDEEALGTIDEQIQVRMDAAEGPGAVVARLFEDEVLAPSDEDDVSRPPTFEDEATP